MDGIEWFSKHMCKLIWKIVMGMRYGTGEIRAFSTTDCVQCDEGSNAVENLIIFRSGRGNWLFRSTKQKGGGVFRNGVEFLVLFEVIRNV